MIQLERFSIALLVLRPDAPQLDDAAAGALQDAHLSHLAELHEAGHLLAAGPLVDPELRGLCIMSVEPGEARELSERDPAVRAGRFSPKVVEWLVPAGAISYSRTRFPRAAVEVAR